MNFSQLGNKFGRLVSDNSPHILTALGVAGIATTAWLTAKASFQASDELKMDQANRYVKEAELGKMDLKDFELTTREKAEKVWKLYIPAVGVGVLTATCVIFANRIGTRRAAAYAAAFTLSKEALGEYRNKVTETIGKGKEQRIHDEVMQDRINRNPRGKQKPLETGGGRDLCYDVMNGRYFYGSMEAIKQAQNAINYKVNHEFYASLTDFYNQIGLDRTKYSDDFGWHTSEQLEVKFTTTIADDGEPCLVMDFLVDPTKEYQRSH